MSFGQGRGAPSALSSREGRGGRGLARPLAATEVAPSADALAAAEVAPSAVASDSAAQLHRAPLPSVLGFQDLRTTHIAGLRFQLVRC